MPAFNFTNNEGRKHVSVVFDDGEVFQATGESPMFNEIMGVVTTEDLTDEAVTSRLRGMFSPAVAIKDKFQALSSDVAIDGGVVKYNGVPLGNALAEKIVDLFYDGGDYVPFVRFLEKFMSNPNPGSIEQANLWIASEQMSLTADGRIVGYKALTHSFRSIHSGPNVIVNGKPWDNTAVDNSVGNVVEMARDNVTYDPDAACSAGLHVGNYGYANGFRPSNGVVVKVLVDPRDIVSVPRDSSGGKMRVCRYEVVDVVEEKVDGHYDYSVGTNDSDDDDVVEVKPGDRVAVSPDAPTSKAGEFATVVNENDDKFLLRFDDDEYRQVAGEFLVVVPNTKVDTRENHLTQKRGPNGRFLPKNK